MTTSAATSPRMKDGLLKRGKTWSYVVRERDPGTGRSRPRWVGGFRTKEDARNARDKARAASHDGTYVAPQTITTGEWLRSWLDAHTATLKPTTQASYRQKVESYLLPHLGAVNLQALSPSRLSKLWATLAASGGKDGAPLSPRSVEFTRAILRKACADAVVERLLTVNPVHGSKSPRRERRDLAIWDDAQQARFLDSVAARDSRWWTVWRLALASGMRRGELCALTWAAVDLDAGTVRVNRSAAQIVQRVVTTDTKSGEDRTIALDPATVTALKAWRKQQATEQLAAGSAWQDTEGLVFTWADGSRVLPDYLSKAFIEQQGNANAEQTAADDLVTKLVERELERSGALLPRLTLHGCRHSHACTLLRAGISVHVVAARLGHADPSLTLRVYSHAIPSDGAGAAAAFARALGAAQ